MRISDWSSDVCSSDLARDLAADFDAHVLAGTATLDLAAAKDAQKIVLDDNGLIIKVITDANGSALSYEVGPRDAIPGAPLPHRRGGARRLELGSASCRVREWTEH